GGGGLCNGPQDIGAPVLLRIIRPETIAALQGTLIHKLHATKPQTGTNCCILVAVCRQSCLSDPCAACTDCQPPPPCYNGGRGDEGRCQARAARSRMCAATA